MILAGVYVWFAWLSALRLPDILRRYVARCDGLRNTIQNQTRMQHDPFPHYPNLQTGPATDKTGSVFSLRSEI
jgi:hypothetical protein